MSFTNVLIKPADDSFLVGWRIRKKYFLMKIKNQPKERLMLSWVYILLWNSQVFNNYLSLFCLYQLPGVSDRFKSSGFESILRALGWLCGVENSASFLWWQVQFENFCARFPLLQPHLLFFSCNGVCSW